MAGKVTGSPQRRMVVVPYRPWRNASVVIGMLLLVVVIGSLLFLSGLRVGGGELGELRSQLNEAAAYRERADSELLALRTQLAIVERTQQVDQQATELAQATMSALRQRITELERDIGLYRQVMGLQTEQPSLQIIDWRVYATEVSDYYRFELMISTSGYEGDPVQVSVDVSLLAKNDDEHTALALQDVMEQGASELNARFRFMHRFGGIINLPAGFEPGSIEIKVTENGRTLSPAESKTAWKIFEE